MGWLFEHSRGTAHDRADLPQALAGRAGGAVRPGHLLRPGGEVPHSTLWVSCLNAFGIEANTFGSPKYCAGGPLGPVVRGSR